MNERCLKCGAELLPVMTFCRRCGFRRTSESSALEQPTISLEVPDNAVTQRLDPRPTGDRSAPSDATVWSAPQPKPKGRRLLFATIIGIILIVGSVCAVTIVRLRSHNRTTATTSLFYPGAKTVVDMTAEGGGRALQLQTSDSLEKVESWYQSTLKPTKTVRLTSNSVVLKNENTTATLAFENNQTEILIKFIP